MQLVSLLARPTCRNVGSTVTGDDVDDEFVDDENFIYMYLISNLEPMDPNDF